MRKSKNAVQSAIEAGEHLIDKLSRPRDRAGATVERVGKMLEAGVDPAVVALQMSIGSANGETYTEADTACLGKLYQDSKTKAPIKADQARVLIRDVQENRRGMDGLAPNW